MISSISPVVRATALFLGATLLVLVVLLGAERAASRPQAAEGPRLDSWHANNPSLDGERAFVIDYDAPHLPVVLHRRTVIGVEDVNRVFARPWEEQLVLLVSPRFLDAVTSGTRAHGPASPRVECLVLHRVLGTGHAVAFARSRLDEINSALRCRESVPSADLPVGPVPMHVYDAEGETPEATVLYRGLRDGEGWSVLTASPLPLDRQLASFLAPPTGP